MKKESIISNSRLTLSAILSAFACVTLFLNSAHSFACMGGAVALNDDVVLLGDSVTTSVSAQTSSSIKELLKSDQTMAAVDSKGIKTHLVRVLGQNADPEGVISTSYFVKEIGTGTEKVLIVRTNYFGNGAFSRGIGRGTSDKIKAVGKFSTLFESGC